MDDGRNHAWSWWYLLLVLQFIPALWVPFYNSVEPTFAGVPFFYWFQLALVFASAAVTAVVYWATEYERALDLNWIALTVFILLFGFITWLRFSAPHSRRRAPDPLHQSGLRG